MVHLYLDIVTTTAKPKLIDVNPDEKWKTIHLSLHGYVLNGEKSVISALPTSIKVTEDGYEKKIGKESSLNVNSWIDLAIGVKLDIENVDKILAYVDEQLSSVLNDKVFLHTKHPVRHKVLPSNLVLIGTHNVGDIITNKLVKKYNMEVVDAEMPKAISTDLIHSGCIEALKYGGKMCTVGFRKQYWKSKTTPIYFRYPINYALVRDTGRETRSLIYDVEDFVSTEMFESTNASAYSYKPIPYYSEVFNLFKSYFKEERYQKFMIEVDNSAMFSGIAKRIFNKFGISAYYLVIGKRRYAVSSLYLGKFLNNSTKSMQEMKLMELNPRPDMVMTRVFLCELYILATKHILGIGITKESQHIEYIDYKEVKWDNSFSAVLSVQGERHKMPFVPEVAFHTEEFANPYLKDKNVECYAVAIKAHGIVYQSMVFMTTDHAYAGNCGEVPVLIGSRSAKKKTLIIKEHKRETQDWHRKILDTISKEDYAD